MKPKPFPAPALRNTPKAAVLRFDKPVLAAENQILNDLIHLATSKFMNRWQSDPQEEIKRAVFWDQLKAFVIAWGKQGPPSVTVLALLLLLGLE